MLVIVLYLLDTGDKKVRRGKSRYPPAIHESARSERSDDGSTNEQNCLQYFAQLLSNYNESKNEKQNRMHKHSKGSRKNGFVRSRKKVSVNPVENLADN
ncbi:MAG: hypothetical protein EBU82_14770 [Flavobacteriia bacterium]|nr:hypothetical protein [Flavobacteriia bacterium]